MTNTSFRIAPWADALFAMDRTWWNKYIEEVRSVFTGELLSSCNQIKHLGILPMGTTHKKFAACGNSGAGAIAVANLYGASRVVLLGYDCQRTGGKNHWHGNHPRGLGNAGSLLKWPAQFKKLAGRISAQVINATRETALEQWPLMDLESALNDC